MSDYLTRLVERSLGLTPRIEPLIAPIHAPSDQALSERVETSAAPEPDRPAATIETSQQDTPPGVAANARGSEPALSHTESQPPPPSNPLPESQAEFLTQKKASQPQPAESRSTAPSHQTSSASRVDAGDTIAASPPDPPLPHATPMPSQGTVQSAVQPEIASALQPEASLQSEITLPINPAASPLVPARELSPTESPLLPRPTTMPPERRTKAIVQSEIITPPRPAASPLVPTLESAAAEPTSLPTTTPTASKRSTQIVVPPENIRPRTATISPRVPLRQPSSNEPPAIHISIGRIEVRAVMPPTPKPKITSPAAPELSLKDYLKQRNGGTR